MKHNKQKNRKKIGIRLKIISYFFVMIAVMIVALWLFQIVFLDDFYRIIKMRNIESCAESISENIDNNGLETLVEDISLSNSMCVLVLKVADGESFESVASAQSSSLANCQIHNATDKMLKKYYDKTIDGGGAGAVTVDIQDAHERNQVHINSENELAIDASIDCLKEPEAYDSDYKGKAPPLEDGVFKSIVYCSLTRDTANREYMIVLNAGITPVDSTVDTLKVQFVIISLLFLLFGIITATFASREVSTPLTKINHGANQLAKGNFDVKFREKSYREVQELSSTLNFAAQELSKTKDLQRELIANVSHDLRTPLTMISGYAEVMRDIPGENTPENTQIIIDEANRLSNLVTDLLDLSKLQSSVQKIDREEFSLTEVIQSILERYAKLCEQDGYRVIFRHDGNVYINADKIKIMQVIYNLINNSINYSGADKTVVVRQFHNDTTVRIEITDHGEGINPDELESIWDRYYKADATHRSAVVGTGLGLSIVKGILELHHARYGAVSNPGEGSAFWFELER